ncbi:putative nuclease HARBI1, partial [Neolecta irregularis DAH-3]
ERFQHSGQTISKYFLEVLHSLVKLYPEVVQLPDPNIIPEEILKNPKFYPYFKNCIGAADGCHILSKASSDDSGRFRNRKGEISQNILGICKFNLQFCYVLGGWEGSAHDGLVLQYALSAGGGLTVPDGKYYLVDAAYALKKGFLPPYRGIRYHLQEQSLAAQRPETKEELFNLRHSQLRNAIERVFGIFKKRFTILNHRMEFSVPIQARIVTALAALHNFIRLNSGRDEIEDWEDGVQISDSEHSPGRVHHSEDDREMAIIREEIAVSMWEDYQNTQR